MKGRWSRDLHLHDAPGTAGRMPARAGRRARACFGALKEGKERQNDNVQLVNPVEAEINAVPPVPNVPLVLVFFEFT